jgi:uncharacterized integral membrane protein (TIGR00698 family)
MDKKKVILFVLLGVCCLPIINSTYSLLMGLIFALFIGNPIKSTTNKWGGFLLRASVIGLGFGINIQILLKAGQENIGTTSVFVLGALGIGFLLGKILQLDEKIALLIATGTAICGGSAIAAVGSAIKADSNQLAVATGIVFLLNAVALFVFPSIGHWLGLSQVQFGTWAAIAIHDTSSVVGAASKYGETALTIASITKMLRILWIIPVTLLLSLSIGNEEKSFKIPTFIVGFIAASCLFSFLPQLMDVYKILYLVAKQALVVSLCLISVGISIENIQKVGVKAMLQAVLLWGMVSVSALYYVMNFVI